MKRFLVCCAVFGVILALIASVSGELRSGRRGERISSVATPLPPSYEEGAWNMEPPTEGGCERESSMEEGWNEVSTTEGEWFEVSLMEESSMGESCAEETEKEEKKSSEKEETTEGMEELEERVEELLNNLDTEELEKYLDSLADFGHISLKEKLLGLVNGDVELDYGNLFRSVLSFVWEEGKAMLPAFAVILAVSLLCGILNSAKNGFLQSTMSDIIHFVGYLSAGGAVLACLIGVLESGFGCIASMQKQMQLVYPILLTLMAASGGAVSVGIFRPAVAFMSGAVVELFTAVVLPSSVAVIVLVFVGNLSEDVRTERLADFFKSVNKWLIGLCLGLFSLFLTVQGIAAAQYDGLSLRAAKYVISGSVPFVGGFLSGGLEIVVAGSILIKNALGSFAIFLLVGTVAKPILLFAAFQIFLRLSAAVTEPAGGKISSFLSRLASDSGFFLAGLCCIAFLYFLTLLLLVCSTGVLL